MSNIYWLRAETKENEFRRVLVPRDCKILIDAGHKVVVEDWKDSIITTKEYKDIGCEISQAGSWVSAPDEAIIMGLKALPENVETFTHTHIFFAHVYKEQDGWRELLTKFKNGGGRIIDLEYMVNEHGRRVAAFGHWAGFVGAAMGAILTNLKNESALNELSNRGFFKNQNELIQFVKDHTDNKYLKAIVIGARGRSGTGASDCLDQLGYDVTKWDIEETQKGGPFVEILEHNLFVNCVLAAVKMPPFITLKMLKENQNLNVISDVSCDPDSEFNMIPIYDQTTKLSSLARDIQGVKLTAIDNLPSILPLESSDDFSSQLISHIADLDSIACRKSLECFTKAISKI